MSGTPTNGESAIWAAAQEYSARGWSLIPMGRLKKRPAVSWKPYQTKCANTAKLRRWFEPGKYGIAVIFGEVSGRLISRDFDTMAAYDAWASMHPEWAAKLPTVATQRGRHVYARVAEGHISNVRFILGKSDATGAIVTLDGELRCGPGCYSVLPPSMHPSGHQYSWIVPLSADALPEVDVFALDFVGVFTPVAGGLSADFKSFGVPKAQYRGDVAKEIGLVTNDAANLECSSSSDLSKFPPHSFSSGVGIAVGTRHREHGENRGAQRQQKTTEAIDGEEGENKAKTPPSPWHQASGAQAAPWNDSIEEAIRASLPRGPGQRHHHVFKLARALKAIPELADAPARELRPYVHHWHQLAFDTMRTKSFDETWIDFLRAWPRVKFPRGHDAMAAILDRAKAAPPPAVSAKFDQPLLILLIAICRELQRVTGEGPFYLSCRTAARLLEVDPTTANRWLFLLTEEEILEVVEKGENTRRRATRYRYLPGIKRSDEGRN